MNASVKAGLAALPSDELRRAFLGAAYTELVGYDPFEDDPNQTVDEIADLYVGVIMEGFNQ